MLLVYDFRYLFGVLHGLLVTIVTATTGIVVAHFIIKVGTKGYILVIEGSVPPFVVRRKHSPNLSPLCLQYITIPVRRYNCRQSRQREVG